MSPVGQGTVELRAVRHHPRASDLEDQLLADQLTFGFERFLQLEQTLLPEGAVGRPVRFVECTSRRVDRTMHIGLRPVGYVAEDLLGGRVEVGEGAGFTLDELAVDEHPRLELDWEWTGHRSSFHRGKRSPLEYAGDAAGDPL